MPDFAKISRYFCLRIFILALCNYSSLSLSQNKQFDSLYKKLKLSQTDSARAIHLIHIGNLFSENFLDSSIKYYSKAANLSNRKFPELFAETKRNLALCFAKKGEYLKSLTLLDSAENLVKSSSNRLLKAKIFDSKGKIYSNCKDYEKALINHFLSLKIREEISEKKGIIESLNHIGIIYQNQNLYKEALKYHERALILQNELKDSATLPSTLNNLGVIKLVTKDYSQAHFYFEEALKIAENQKKSNILHSILDNFVLLLLEKKEYNRALLKAQYALNLAVKSENSQSVISSSLGITKVYLALKNLKNAEEYGLQTFELSKRNKENKTIAESASLLAKIYQEKNECQKAYQFSQLHNQFQDSIHNQERNREIYFLTLRKQQSDNEQLEKELKVSELKLNVVELRLFRRKILIYASFLIAILSFALFIFALISRKKSKNTNRLLQEKNREILEKNYTLTQQKEELFTSSEIQKKANEEISEMYTHISSQNELLEMQNRQIRESLTYARQAQIAMLPRKEYINSIIPNFFVYFKPEHIVGGDFYYFKRFEDTLYIAVAESNNSKLPGVFVSMLANAFLNEIIDNVKDKEHSAASILEQLYTKFTTALNISKEENRFDALSINICMVNKNTRKLSYSSINSPSVLIRDNDIIPLHSALKRITKEVPQDMFQDREILLLSNDYIYLFTHGIVKQTGGSKGSALGLGRFRKILKDISLLDISDQYLALENEYNHWKGNNEQIGDVLVIGMKIN